MSDEKSSEQRYSEIAKAAPDTLCLYPFTHVNFKFQGALGCCFRSKALVNVDLTKAPGDGFWNAEEFRSLRKSLAAGEKNPHCESCWKQESWGEFSYRQMTLEDLSIHRAWREALHAYDGATGEMKTGPRQVEIRLSNLCNLSCRMCTPEYSSKWAGLLEKSAAMGKWRRAAPKHAPEHEALLLSFLERHRSSLKYIMFSGGEPLLQKSHYAALQALHPHESEIDLEYTTNLNTLRDEHESVLDYWPRFRQVRVKISIDADPEIYSFVRAGGDIGKVEDNIRALQARFPTQNRIHPESKFPEDQLILMATCTVSVYNVARLPEIAKYFTRIGALFHTSQVQSPIYQNAQVLPKEIKQEVSGKIERFLAQLERELDPYWKDQPLWKNPEARATQMERIRHFVGNSLSALNGKDLGEHREKLLQFERDFSSATSTAPLLEIYPEWKAFF